MEKSIWVVIGNGLQGVAASCERQARGDTETDWWKNRSGFQPEFFPTIYFTEESLYCNTHSRVH